MRHDLINWEGIRELLQKNADNAEQIESNGMTVVKGEQKAILRAIEQMKDDLKEVLKALA